MAIRITRWEPDTHPGTIIDIEWDDAVPEDERTHTPVKAWQRGHDGKIDPHPEPPVALHDRVLAENRRKNQALAHAAENMPAALLKDELDSDNEPTGRKIPKDKHAPQWRMDSNGNVIVSIPGANSGQKAALRSKLSAKFGGSVTLED